MTLDTWLAFVAASALLLVLPGPTILTVISYSLTHGRRANVPLVAAVALGDSTALALSLLGLGALLATSAFWFTLVKVAGGLYLLHLGFRMLRAGVRASGAGVDHGPAGDPVPGGRPPGTTATAPADSAPTHAAGTGAVTGPGQRWQLFGHTWLVTALNPKGIVFFVAFLPQFLNPALPVARQMWVLAITFVVMATLNAALYATFAAAARRLLASPRAQRRFNLTGGALLSGAGVWALLARRAST